MGLIDRILTTEEFVKAPPVLIDIGASGKIHKKWKKIAKYATCIAFDADDRDFDPAGTEKTLYKKLLIKKNLLNDQPGYSTDFYLTVSPHCSSLLKPDHASLKDWAYAPIFRVDRVVQLPTTDLSTTLQEFGINYIDWYKSDSQGIDLKLFRSLAGEIRDNITIAEFEPGILDAYESEDKLQQMLSFQNELKKFWLAELNVKSTLRIPHEKLNEIVSHPFLQKLIIKVGPQSPGWAEMAYLNNLSNEIVETRRALLMGWIGATLLKQHGFAYTIADKGLAHYKDPLFDEMKRSSGRKLLLSYISLKYVSLLIKKLW